MLDLVLYGPGGPQPLGRPAPVRAEIRNTGSRDLWIAGVLDGSENGLRWPRYLPTVTCAEDGGVVARPAPAEDPLVGPLRPGDLRRLAPGESFDPATGPGCLPLMTFAHFVPQRPGRFRYALSLSTEAARPEEWLGGFGLPDDSEREALLALVARVPRTTVTAAPLDVDFR
ncbi:hypothetical protein [Streptomyces liliifuscus]|uniref:Uncharacterized protein n=1 Tax=Streptomyces liliifuscus TaxID=2797636 RepID=A0A7T7KUK1_9ACTN|nr:hypothetical protein [Streptomyces liliifuscus]QQM39063.1 hypothetical protein JEQ17_05990 [Streptomyces liliifuscus]